MGDSVGWMGGSVGLGWAHSGALVRWQVTCRLILQFLVSLLGAGQSRMVSPLLHVANRLVQACSLQTMCFQGDVKNGGFFAITLLHLQMAVSRWADQRGRATGGKSGSLTVLLDLICATRRLDQVLQWMPPPPRSDSWGSGLRVPVHFSAVQLQSMSEEKTLFHWSAGHPSPRTWTSPITTSALIDRAHLPGNVYLLCLTERSFAQKLCVKEKATMVSFLLSPGLVPFPLGGQFNEYGFGGALLVAFGEFGWQ